MKMLRYALALAILVSCTACSKKDENSNAAPNKNAPATPGGPGKPRNSPTAKKARKSGDFLWEQHPRVTWSDFKGQPPRNTSLAAVSSIGFTWVNFSCTKGLLDAKVSPNFSPANSWVKQKTDKLLRHEQGHFDISELYARKMRKAVEDGNIACENFARATSAGEKIVDHLAAEYCAAQKQYDLDTTNPNDGIDSIQQEATSDQIEKKLDALSAYKQDANPSANADIDKNKLVVADSFKYRVNDTSCHSKR